MANIVIYSNNKDTSIKAVLETIDESSVRVESPSIMRDILC